MGANCTSQIASCKLHLANCISKIASCKLLPENFTNCMLQISCCKLHEGLQKIRLVKHKVTSSLLDLLVAAKKNSLFLFMNLVLSPFPLTSFYFFLMIFSTE